MAVLPIEQSFISSLAQAGGKPSLQLNPVAIDSTIMSTEIGGIFLGQHTGLGIPVIVRVLHPCTKARMVDFEHFVRETRQLGQLRHTNIANVFDVGLSKGHAYLVTEYVSGVPLSERIQDRPFHEAKALGLLVPIAEGLAEFWRRGIVHRSVAPWLIRISAEGTPKLDFGTLRTGYNDPMLKLAIVQQTGMYWSPEEVRGDELIDMRSDMWSFGATLYHMVTGAIPFPGATVEEVHRKILSEPPVDPKAVKPGLHEAVRQFVLQLLEKEPEDRFSSPDRFLTALNGVVNQITHDSTRQPTVLLSDSKGPSGPFSRLKASEGDVIGNCLLEKEVGSGAFGVVFRARHTVLDIPVAVKVLPHHLAQRDPNYISLFLREARTAARIRHPNVIGIFEAGNQNGQHYLIMEFAPGGTVLDRMEQLGGRLPVSEVVRILLEAARGLAAAEALCIIHRDIKPENLMFGTRGELKIADMGLAKRLLPAGGSIRESLVADQISMQKGANDIVGTPAYMAPEIALSPEKVDTRADLYSLGCTGYHMITGELPFTGKTSIETIMKHISEPPLRPEMFVPTIPKELSAVVLKLMAKNPDDRYEGARELEAALMGLKLVR